jgi:glycosyltransferase involved in cell wall biosynthesis
VKILWVSNAPWYPTGYGQQTALFAPRIRRLGYDIAIFAFCGLQGGRIQWRGIRIYPGASDVWGNDIAIGHARDHFGQSAGVVITLVDVWPLDCFHTAEIHVASWTPVDHDPAPPPVLKYFETTKAIPIAMSRFGERRLKESGLDPLYIPHGIDTKSFRLMDRTEARAIIGLPPDKFVIGMVAANKGTPSRKSLGEAIEAYARFYERRPESVLYLHTERTGVFQGINIDTLVKQLGLPDSSVAFCNQYNYWLSFPAERMCATFNAMDVLLNPARGEGFGIPIIEAQACGTPVIVSDFTSMPELAGVGWKVTGQRSWTPLGSWQLTPDVGDIVLQLEKAYDSRGNPAMRDAARDFATQYDADHVTGTYWKPALDAIQERCGLLSLRTPS